MMKLIICASVLATTAICSSSWADQMSDAGESTTGDESTHSDCEAEPTYDAFVHLDTRGGRALVRREAAKERAAVVKRRQARTNARKAAKIAKSEKKSEKNGARSGREKYVLESRRDAEGFGAKNKHVRRGARREDKDIQDAQLAARQSLEPENPLRLFQPVMRPVVRAPWPPAPTAVVPRGPEPGQTDFLAWSWVNGIAHIAEVVEVSHEPSNWVPHMHSARNDRVKARRIARAEARRNYGGARESRQTMKGFSAAQGSIPMDSRAVHARKNASKPHRHSVRQEHFESLKCVSEKRNG